jgi:hypothetical protein
MGAATRRCRRSLLRHRAQAGRALSGARPNEQGYERARAVGADEVAVFTAASEAFNRKNINASIDESIERFRPVIERAKADGVRVRGYVSTVLGCPYQGDVPVEDVVRVAQRMHDLGCYEVSLGDTIGVGTPQKARAMLRAVAQAVPMSALAVHFHDTYGQALPQPARLPRRRCPRRRRVGERHRRLSVRQGRERQRREPKTSCTCCTAWGCIPAWTSTASSTPAAGSPPSSAGPPAAK